MYTTLYTLGVSPQQAIDVIRDCVAADHVIIKDHFLERLAERGLFWGDVLGVLESPDGIRDDGYDEYDRERWFLAGTVAGRYSAEILCVIDADGPTTVFITLYWEK